MDQLWIVKRGGGAGGACDHPSTRSDSGTAQGSMAAEFIRRGIINTGTIPHRAHTACSAMGTIGVACG